jgi:protein O-GlcNAc transferase
MGHLIGPGKQEANEHLRTAHQAEPQNLEYLQDFMEGMNRARYGQESANIQEAYELAQKLMSQAKTLLPYASTLYPILLRCGNLAALDQIGTLEELGAHWASKAQPSAIPYLFGRVKTLQDRRRLIDYHRVWGQQVEADAARRPIERPAHAKRRDKIRVGIMSSDLRGHPVSYFVHPLLANYDRTRFEFYCYSYFDGVADAIQNHISEIVDVFRLIPGIAARDAARLIANDDLDILIELGGKTAKNKLEVMAWKPAPLCASWLGYQHSCGLSTIDYVVVDPFINPSVPGLLIEKPLILDRSWIVMEGWAFDQNQFSDQEIPEERNGWLTFGTMNNPYKFSAAALAAWAEILSKAAHSRFLFVRPEADTYAFKEHMWRAFEAGGVARERVEFVPGRGAHLPHYNDIDIALDTFPQTGATTTCESLWMGVPVVSLVGDAFFERASYSNLSNAGLADLCAFDRPGYIDTALALANDRTRRKYLRQSLRSDIRARPLGRVKDFVADFQTAVERVVR